ncbi:MAG: hypothetical protein GEU80_14425 [Dehalococcoidia bacterium]|nr:hypothetical protein [Dehalococcoidia bacterium]
MDRRIAPILHSRRTDALPVPRAVGRVARVAKDAPIPEDRPPAVTVDELRHAFLAFFQARGHRLIPSSSLVPHGDPTLLFTNAGMVQFKPYFMGLEEPPAARLTSIQRCFRTTDV